MAGELVDISVYDWFGGDPDDTFGSVLVHLADGTKYSISVETFKHFYTSRAEERRDGDWTPEGLLVSRLDRATIEPLVRERLAQGGLPEQWKLPPELADCIDHGHDFGRPEFVVGQVDLFIPPADRYYCVVGVAKTCRRCGEVVTVPYSAEEDPDGREAEAAIARARLEDETDWSRMLADRETRVWIRQNRYCSICGVDSARLTTTMMLLTNENGEGIVYCPACWTREIGLAPD